MNNCDFCQHILTLDEFNNTCDCLKYNQYGIFSWLVVNNEGQIALYSFSSTDDYYYNIYDYFNVYYCPICGRKLEVLDNETK